MRRSASIRNGFTYIEMLLAIMLVAFILLLGAQALYQITVVHHDTFPYRQKQMMGEQLLFNYLQQAVTTADRVGVTSASRYWTGSLSTQTQLPALSNLGVTGTGTTPAILFADNSGNVNQVLLTINPSALSSTEQSLVQSQTPRYTTVSTLNGNVTRDEWASRYLVQFWTWVGGQYQLEFQTFLPDNGPALSATVSGSTVYLTLPSPALPSANILLRNGGQWNSGFRTSNVVILSGKEVTTL